MSAIAEVQKEDRKMVNVQNIRYEELQPGDEFWVVREKNDFSLLKIQEVWQFEVLEILPEFKIAKIEVIFPRTGHEEIDYLEMAAVGGTLRVYTGPEKTGYFLDDNIVDIVVFVP